MKRWTVRTNELQDHLHQTIHKEPEAFERSGELNIAPLIRSLTLTEREGVILADAVVAAQDPGLNPALIGAAVARHLPEIAPDFVRVRRKEVYDAEMNVFR